MFSQIFERLSALETTISHLQEQNKRLEKENAKRLQSEHENRVEKDYEMLSNRISALEKEKENKDLNDHQIKYFRLQKIPKSYIDCELPVDLTKNFFVEIMICHVELDCKSLLDCYEFDLSRLNEVCLVGGNNFNACFTLNSPLYYKKESYDSNSVWIESVVSGAERILFLRQISQSRFENLIKIKFYIPINYLGGDGFTIFNGQTFEGGSFNCNLSEIPIYYKIL